MIVTDFLLAHLHSRSAQDMGKSGRKKNMVLTDVKYSKGDDHVVALLWNL